MPPTTLILTLLVVVASLVMHLRGLPAPLPVAVALTGVALLTGALLVSLLSHGSLLRTAAARHIPGQMTPSVRHVLTILAVERFRQSVDFYRTAFGWETSVDTPVYLELVLPGGQRLGIYERESFGRNTGQTPEKVADGALAPVELYLYADDLTAAIERVRSAGGRELSPLARRPWGDDAAYFADPSGNVLALARAGRT